MSKKDPLTHVLRDDKALGCGITIGRTTNLDRYRKPSLRRWGIGGVRSDRRFLLVLGGEPTCRGCKAFLVALQEAKKKP